MRPGNSASSTLKRSATISGAWFGSITPPEPTRICDVDRRNLPDHDFGRGTGDVREIMVLGDPVALVAEPVGKPRQIERIAQRHRARRGGGDGRQVEDGKRGHACSGGKCGVAAANLSASTPCVNPASAQRPGVLTNGPPTAEPGRDVLLDVTLTRRIPAGNWNARGALTKRGCRNIESGMLARAATLV